MKKPKKALKFIKSLKISSKLKMQNRNHIFKIEND